jgi:N-acetylneuraminic acid mutarotase
MASKRNVCAVAEVGGMLYVMGGYDGHDTHKSVEQFDSVARTWTPMPQMKCERRIFAAAAINGKIYVTGGEMHGGRSGWDAVGFDATRSSMECFDPATHVWTDGPPMSTPRSGHAAVALNGKLYVVGGGCGTAPSKTCECYDPITSTWSNMPSMITKRSNHRAAVIDGKLYVVGGKESGGGVGLRSVECFDPATNTWHEMPAMTTGREGALCVAF